MRRAFQRAYSRESYSLGVDAPGIRQILGSEVCVVHEEQLKPYSPLPDSSKLGGHGLPQASLPFPLKAVMASCVALKLPTSDVGAPSSREWPCFQSILSVGMFLRNVTWTCKPLCGTQIDS